MKIAVIGTGALGCLLAATLQPGHDVVMVGRWAAQIEAIAARGLTLIAPDGNRSRHAIPATADPATLPKTSDLALVAVKSRQTARAAHDSAVALGASGGLGVTFQNGLGHLAMLQAALTPERATLAVTSQGATLEGLATVRHAGHGPTTIGVPDQLSPAARELAHRLAAALREAGWACDLSPDVDDLVWQKLAVNAAINPLTAVLGVSNGALVADARLAAVLDAAAREVAAVAKATGIPLDEDEAAARARQVARDTAGNRSSMLQDIERGVPTEIDAICGAVVDAAAEVGREAAIDATLRDLVRRREQAADPLDVATVLDALAQAGAPVAGNMGVGT